MRRFMLLLPLAAVVGLWVASGTRSQPPEDDFGVLKTKPASSLPAGVEPARPISAQATGFEPFRPATTPARIRPTPPPNPFPLTVEVGPWVICTAHYVGFDGFSLAQQLALELRNTHHLNAYIYNRGDEERRKQDEEWERDKARFPPGAHPRRKYVRINDEQAVLIGGFKDPAAASALLPRIKALPLPKLTLEGDKSPYEMMMYAEADPKTGKPILKRMPINPFHNAMVVRNPILADGQFNKPHWDPIWKKLNAGEERSLLKNPKEWTLKVREYAGGGQLIQTGASTGKTGGFLGALGMSSSEGSSLDATAAQAQELAKFLSNKRFGFETWVLHTRTSSIVTVGGFNGPNDPELQRVQERLGKLEFKASDTQRDPIGLMRPALPVMVPRP